MKYLTITVPCYNSEQYIKRCLNSLVKGGENVEIIIVNDGSTDQTGAIADSYARQFPDIVKVVHKENGGHGSGVNTGLALATGKYFKVVDSDDWLSESAYLYLLQKIENWCCSEKNGQKNSAPDLLICDYTYNHLDEGTKKRMGYRNVFPTETVFSWDEIKTFRPSQYLIMHSLIYRTEILRQSKVTLPEHTFYVDNIFAYYPLPYVKTLYYIDKDLYQYYLGRADQSVNENVLISRIDQQIKVTKIVAESVDLNQVKKEHPKLAGYMCRNVSIMMAISSIHLLLCGDEHAKLQHCDLWSYLKRSNPRLYYRLRFTTISGLTSFQGNLGRKAAVDGYRIAKKIYKFQ